MKWKVVLSFCMMLCVAVVGGVSADQKAALKPVGTNLPLVDFYAPYMFTDLFKQSRDWLPQSSSMWDTGESEMLDLDEHGWVRSLPATDETSTQYDWVATQIGDATYPAGQYRVYYDGEGVIEYGFAAVKNELLSTPAYDVIDVTPHDAGIVVRIMETNPADYIRNIRVLMPGFDAATAPTFHPDFIDNLAIYDTIRFTQWQHTNTIMGEESLLGSFMDRPKPTDARYTSEQGVPIEIMVELVNELGSDVWFNMRHDASDEYITEFARSIRDSLGSEQSAYIEYSNEVWNTGFYQSEWIETQAEVMWPDSPVSSLEKRLNWYGMRSAQTCDLWQTAWGEEADRLSCVFGSQASNTWISEKILQCSLWEDAPCDDRPNSALAIAPYFGQHIGHQVYEATVTGWTTDPDGGLNKLFEELEYGSLLDDSITKTTFHQAVANITAQKTVADTHNFTLTTYESGQHLVGIGSAQFNPVIVELLNNANRDPRMETLYCSYLTAWDNAGGGLHNHALNVSPYSRWSTFGASESYAASGPKLNALTAYATTGQCSTIPLAVTLASANANEINRLVIWSLFTTLLFTAIWLHKRKNA